MIPQIFAVASGSTEVRGLLGSNPVRFWPFGSAPQKDQPGYGLPYAVWQLVYGSPENFLGQTPDADTVGIQVDAYAPTASLARDVATALRDAFEPYAYVVSYNGEDRETSTALYRFGFTVEWITTR